MSRRSFRQGSRIGISGVSVTARVADGKEPRLPSESSWSGKGARPGVQRPESGPCAARSCAILSRGSLPGVASLPQEGETALMVVFRTLTPGDLTVTETGVWWPPTGPGQRPWSRMEGQTVHPT